MNDEQKMKARAREKAWRQAHPEKSREYARRHYLKNLEKSRARVRKYNAEHREQIKKYEAAHVEQRREISKRWREKNPEKQSQASRAWRKSPEGVAWIERHHTRRYLTPADRLRRSIKHAKERAQKKSFEFEDALFDVLLPLPPKNCACCGVLLDYDGRGHAGHARSNRASLDRIDNNIGYTVANTAVICMKCNALKSHGTAEELRTVAAYIEKMLLQ
jgi:hypothetical protein